MADLPEDTITSPWLRQTASHTHAIVQGCDGPAALLEAARCGDSAVLAKLLRAGADPNHRQEVGNRSSTPVIRPLAQTVSSASFLQTLSTETTTHRLGLRDGVPRRCGAGHRGWL